MFLAKIALSLLGFLGGSNVGKFIDGASDFLKNRTNAQLQEHINENDAGRAAALAFMQGEQRLAEIKLEDRRIEGKWGPRVMACTILFVIPYGLHSAMIVFDSMPLFGHVVGSWGVEKLPGLFEETEHLVIRSMFYVSGGVTAVSMLAKAFRR